MYFKIKTGYSDNDFVSIDNMADLEKAQLAFLTNGKVVFSNGQVCRGQDIISIKEDWHKEMGWNPTHPLDELDWNDLNAKGVVSKYRGLLGVAKENIQTLTSANRQDLVGKSGTLEERMKMLETK